ncbi:unnamed protein product [Ascophyllum nodosum]
MVSEQERMKRMKKMSKVLGVNISQVAALLAAQERAENGIFDDTAPESDSVAGAEPGNAEAHKKDDPFTKFVREQNGSSPREPASQGTGGASPKGDASATSAATADTKKKEEMPPCTVLFCGGTDWHNLGRRSTEGGDVPCPKVLSFPKRIKYVASGPTAFHSVCIDVHGGVYTWGRNENGALGHGDLKTRAHPTLVASLTGTKMKQASCGKTHTAVLAENGTLYVMGGGKLGQLGQGRALESCTEPRVVNVAGGTVHKVSCGAEFTAIIDSRGRLLTFGSPQEGQLGSGTTGEFIEKAGKISYDLVLSPSVISVFISKDPRSKAVEELRGIELADVSCGKNHCVALERAPRARVFTWGFGGYGRLGHACQDNELRPRVVEGLARLTHVTVASVSAGGGCSMATTTNGHLFYWGKLPNAPRGEATMYPRIVDDLSNWQSRSVAGSNGAILVAAETSTISWGTSVAGELGYGEEAGKPRTSTKPKLVDAMEGVTMMQVAMGFGHSILLAKDDEKSAATYEKLGECVPFERDDTGAGSEDGEEEPPAKKKRGPGRPPSRGGGSGRNAKKGAGGKGKGKGRR